MSERKVQVWFRPDQRDYLLKTLEYVQTLHDYELGRTSSRDIDRLAHDIARDRLIEVFDIIVATRAKSLEIRT